MVRFTVVRNPYTRILSSYLDKHLLGGHVQHDRHVWNKIFFEFLPPGSIPDDNTDGFINFQEWVAKVGAVVKAFPGQVESHIAPQSELCALNSFKYDFVASFENLGEDIELLAEVLRLHEKRLPRPDLGKVFHSTDSAKKMGEMYDQVAVNEVGSAYQMDLKCPLNNVSFTVPAVLASLP
eukprot:TRINITY_DN2512_c0_g1_i3.p1 TRINITY_DN2512_c0_g1~~TRINITY_DN2512_c0_g1_i3.p1  ORF type:complete len:180 (-),score=24.64 TRINITY_DN2512_c0_g1_i3:920-1459(-)